MEIIRKHIFIFEEQGNEVLLELGKRPEILTRLADMKIFRISNEKRNVCIFFKKKIFNKRYRKCRKSKENTKKILQKTIQMFVWVNEAYEKLQNKFNPLQSYFLYIRCPLQPFFAFSRENSFWKKKLFD